MTSKLPSLTALLACVALTGCLTPPPEQDPAASSAPKADEHIGEAIRNAQLDQAILRQHTLYTYHFQTGSAALNGLGLRDLDVLAANLRRNPGEINVHRGDASQALYDARLKTVGDRLVAAGIPAANIAIQDGIPGGDGISGERVIGVLKKEQEGLSESFGSSNGNSNRSGNSSSSNSSSTSSGTTPQ
jgi:hypothetical protein